jgi:hypothetical protein
MSFTDVAGGHDARWGTNTDSVSARASIPSTDAEARFLNRGTEIGFEGFVHRAGVPKVKACAGGLAVEARFLWRFTPA